MGYSILHNRRTVRLIHGIILKGALSFPTPGTRDAFWRARCLRDIHPGAVAFFHSNIAYFRLKLAQGALHYDDTVNSNPLKPSRRSRYCVSTEMYYTGLNL